MQYRNHLAKGVTASLVVSLGLVLDGQSVRGDQSLVAGSDSALGGLLGASDLETRVVKHEHWTDGSHPKVTVKTLARQSVPDQNRAAYYRTGEVFSHSKIAMPLLVVDLEPQGLLYVRPMSGRSVGATPTARWTRAVSTVEVAPEGVR
jgi:hypothetical protein